MGKSLGNHLLNSVKTFSWTSQLMTSYQSIGCRQGSRLKSFAQKDALEWCI